jgi:hypothetical protein
MLKRTPQLRKHPVGILRYDVLLMNSKKKIKRTVENNDNDSGSRYDRNI